MHVQPSIRYGLNYVVQMRTEVVMAKAKKALITSQEMPRNERKEGNRHADISHEGQKDEGNICRRSARKGEASPCDQEDGTKHRYIWVQQDHHKKATRSEQECNLRNV